MPEEFTKYDLAEYKYHFDYSLCKQIIIESYSKAINDKPDKSAIVEDKTTMDELFKMLKAFPKEGEMYVSFTGEIDLIKVYFVCNEDKIYVMHLYGHRVKTEGTSFCAQGQAVQLEKKICQFLLDQF